MIFDYILDMTLEDSQNGFSEDEEVEAFWTKSENTTFVNSQIKWMLIFIFAMLVKSREEKSEYKLQESEMESKLEKKAI